MIYDAATVNATAMVNAKGHLAEMLTTAQGAGCAAAKITDEGYSYDARGEVGDFYLSTPHSGGYYHSTATYAANGVPTYITAPAG